MTVLALTIWCPHLSCAHFCAVGCCSALHSPSGLYPPNYWPSDTKVRAHPWYTLAKTSIWIFQPLLLIARELSGIPLLAGDTSHHTSPWCFSIARTCGAIWCDVIPNTPWLFRVNKTLARPASITGPSYFCIEFISLAVCFDGMMRQLFTKILQHNLAKGQLTFNLSSLRNPVKAYDFSSGHQYYL